MKCECGFQAKFLEMSREPNDHFAHLDSSETISADALLDFKLPIAEAWHFTCVDCGLADPYYYVPLDRMKDERQALSWTLHLLQKGWFSYSTVSWEDAVEKLFPGVKDAG